MASRTLTVKTVGQPDKTITINRDRFAGVRTMTRQDADGSSKTITIDRSPTGTKYGDKPGQSRPLLDKVVGGAAAAYSLRDLNDAIGSTNVVEVRRDSDDAEKTFKAQDVNKIADWVNGKQETTLPVDLTRVGDGSNAYFSNPDSSYYDCGTFSVGAGETWEAEVEMAILSFGNYVLPFGYNSWSAGYGLIFYSTGYLRAFSNGDVLTAQPSGVTEGQLFTAKYGYDGSNVFVDINGNRVYTSSANTQTGASNVPLRLGGGSNLTDNPCIIKSAKLTVNGTLIRNYTNITPASTITDATGTQDATVSGSLSDIKTADKVTTSVAYSLRKVNSNYTGDAVRIRRASDDVEVNVAFDTTGAVSASSAITNVPEEFLSNDFTDGWVEEAGATIVDSNTFTTSATAQGISLAVANGKKLKITVAGTATGAAYRIYDWSDGGIKATLSGTFSTTVEFTTVGNQNKIYFRSTGAGTLDVTSLTIEVINDAGGDTTATTLGGFLTGNENSLVDFSSGSDNLFSHDDQTTIVFGSYGNDLSRTAYNHLTDSESIGSSPVSTSDYSFRLDSRVSSGYSAAHGILIGPKVEQYFYSVTFKYYIPEGEPSLAIVYGTAAAPLNVKGAWTEATITSQVGQSHRNFLLRSGAFGSTGGLWYIADIRLNLSAFDTFVQTWYDQSGNNYHATQDTTDDQPKIAEAGALLADGLDFDGTNSQMDIVGFVPFSTAYTAFTVATIDNPTSSSLKTIFDNTDTGNGGFAVGYGNTANKLTPFMYHGDSSVPVVFSAGSDLTSNKSLYSVKFTSGNSGTFINSTSDDADSTTWSSAGSNAFTKSTIGYDQATPGRNFNGKLNEFIIYETDQTSNRFKIESNINNYYGIYESGDQVTMGVADSNGGTLTNASSTGATLESSSSKFLGWELPRVLDAGETLSVEFDYLLESGSPSSVLVQVATGLSSGQVTNPNTQDVTTSGKYSKQFSVSTGAGSHIRLNIQASSAYKISVSNLKVFVGGKNGFVETWYDQSGNGRHAEQPTNDDQPQIVSNGSLLAGGVDLRASELVLSSSLSTEDYSVFTVNSGASGSSPWILKGNLNAPAIRTSSSNVRVESYAPQVVKIFAVASASSNQRLDSVFKDSSDDARVFRNATESTSGTQNIGSGSSPFTRIGRITDSGSIPVAEIIFFESDQTANRPAIEANIANQYNLTLS